MDDGIDSLKCLLPIAEHDCSRICGRRIWDRQSALRFYLDQHGTSVAAITDKPPAPEVIQRHHGIIVSELSLPSSSIAMNQQRENLSVDQTHLSRLGLHW